MSRCTRGKEQLASVRVMDGRERATRAGRFAIKGGTASREQVNALPAVIVNEAQ